MPQTKNQLIRYLALDKCLRDTKRRYFMPDLVAACQKALLEYDGSTVEERTVRKDLQDMKRDSLYAAPINKYMDGHSAWYRYSNSDFSICNLPMSQLEMTLLSDTIQMLHRFSGLPKFEWMNEVFVRFEDAFQIKGDVGNAVCFSQNERLIGIEFFNKLFEAIVSKTVLRVKYAKYGKTTKEHIVHPYQLKQYNNRWFLVGLETTDRKHTSIKVFPLDRIKNISLEDKLVYQEYYGNIDDYFCDVVGVTVDSGKAKEKIRLKFYHPAADYVYTKPIHHSQKVVEFGENYYIIELQLIPNYEFETILLGYSDLCEIIEPFSLRESIRHRALRIIERNNNS